MQTRIGIGEAAARAGVAPSALRYYESEGLLPPAERVSGRRVYPPGVVDRVALIQTAQAAGFSLAEIRSLIRSGGTNLDGALERAFRLEARAAALRRWLEAGRRVGTIDPEGFRLAERPASLEEATVATARRGKGRRSLR
ncbi:MAG TPA: MerR family transcriptional regulator [Actinomycetota bacterium]|jgi:DNA-binding transcriptional MerR regulator|nr:MerR family transcriptional regulator [Actinomycetota bacterium]